MFKFNQSKTNLTLPTGRQVNQTPTITPITQNNSFKFDLKGPIVCDDLLIQNKKVLLKNKLNNYLLNGDCLYVWVEGKLNGEKKCGLSNYIGMAENYLGFLKTDDLINNNLAKNFIKDKDINLTKIIKSCKRKEIKDNSIFEIPKQVIFNDKK